MQQKRPGYQKTLIKLVTIPSRFLYAILKAILKTLFLDLFINMKKEVIYIFNPMERDKIKSEIETKRLLDLVNDRLKRIERLVYSIFSDPEYIKRDHGKSDLKELGKDLK